MIPLLEENKKEKIKGNTFADHLREYFQQLQDQRREINASFKKKYGHDLYASHELNLIPDDQDLSVSEKRLERLLGSDLRGPFKEIRAFVRNQWDRFKEVAPYFFHFKKNRRDPYAYHRKGLFANASFGHITARYLAPSIFVVGGILTSFMNYTSPVSSPENVFPSRELPQQHTTVKTRNDQKGNTNEQPKMASLETKVRSQWVKVEQKTLSHGPLTIYGKEYENPTTVNAIAKDYLRNVRKITHPTEQQIAQVKRNMYLVTAKTPEQERHFNSLFKHIRNLQVLFYGNHYTQPVANLNMNTLGKNAEVYILEDAEKDYYFQAKKQFPSWKTHPYEPFFGKKQSSQFQTPQFQFKQRRNYAMRRR